MVLIFGGAYQGKLDYARSLCGGASVYTCADMNPAADLSKDVIDSFHLLTLALLRAGANPLQYIEDNLESLKTKVIISDDISCGVVPLEPLERQWREATGRCLARLAGHADEVVRVFCGIGTRIK